MVAALIALGYLLVRIMVDLLRTETDREGMKFSAGKLLVAFGIFSFMTFLVFLEVYVITDLLARQYSNTFSFIYSVLTFVVGYELANILLDKFSGEGRSHAKMILSMSTFLHYFYNSFFGLIFLIIAAMTLLYF